jgi:predicted PurR-regulated permease PerM/protein-S-isoprenylcysteine O-methyltransferase Ste14
MAIDGAYGEFVKRLLTTVLVVIVIIGAWYVRNILLLGFLAALVAIAIHIPAHRLERWGYPHALAVLLSTTVLILATVLLNIWILPSIIVGVAELVALIPSALNQAGLMYEQWRLESAPLRTILPPLVDQSFGEAQAILGLDQQQLGTFAVGIINSALPVLQGLGNVILSFLANSILVIFIAVLLLVEPRSYATIALMLLPRHSHHRFVDIWNQVYRTVTHWIIAQTLSVTITVVLVWLILGLLLQMPNALIVALFAGLATFIPNIGAFLPLIPIAVFTLVDDPTQFWLIAPVYLLIQLIESNVLTPSIFRVELDIPLAGLLFTQVIAVSLFGALGLLLAAPLLAVLATIIRELYSYDQLGLRGAPPTVTTTAQGGLQLIAEMATPAAASTKKEGITMKDHRNQAVTATESDLPSAAARRGAQRWLAREIFGTILVALLLLGISGRWDWAMGWAVVALYALWVTANALLIMPRDPALLAERAKRRMSDRRWDQIILALFGISTLAKYIVAALDERYGWSPMLPLALAFGALAVAALGYGLVTWSMVANSYFATVSRIQTERQQRVATGGPYRYVRHPGYSGSILFDLATPLALGSLWALIPGLISALLMVSRTALEDRMLQQELAGYQDFAQSTRYRLLPGLW